MNDIIEKFVNKTISNVYVNGELVFSFTDGTRLHVSDDGQSCCENRYMTTDDNLSYYSGAQFLGLEVVDGGRIDSDYDCHDTQFLIVGTSKGSFTCVTHNEHNGYYGGFWIQARTSYWN